MQYIWKMAQCDNQARLQDCLNMFEEEGWQIFSVLHGAAPRLFYVVARKKCRPEKERVGLEFFDLHG
jgi:hypothetical protein